MSNGTRKDAVKGLFYPSECDKVEAYFREFTYKNKMMDISTKMKNIVPRAIIVPHAGYVYSGLTANLAFSFLKKTNATRIIIVGPSHHHSFAGISGSYFENYETPCGNLDIDSPYLFALAKQFNIGFVAEAHQEEHSTQVQMPFVKHYFGQSKIIELIYGEIPSKTLATLFTVLLQNKDNALVVSSDLSHFYTLEEAKRLDAYCLKAVSELNIEEFKKGCEACGGTGILAMLYAAKHLKLSSKVLDYRTSAEATKDSKSVVGYMSAMFYL